MLKYYYKFAPFDSYLKGNLIKGNDVYLFPTEFLFSTFREVGVDV